MKRKKNQDRLETYVYQHDGEKDDAFGDINCGHIQTCRGLQMSATNGNREGRRGASGLIGGGVYVCTLVANYTR